MKTSKVSLVGSLIITSIGVLIGATLPWGPELSLLDHRVLMILLISVGLWVFKPFNIPFSMVSFFMLASFVVIGIPMTQVFSGFTTGAIWTMIPALLMGYIILKTGLGNRIALVILMQFKPSYRNLIFVLLSTGIILSMLTPSITVRVSILMPVALSIATACKIKGNSKEGALILLTSMIVAMVPGTGWLTGSLYGPTTLGMFETVPELEGIITFSTWSKVNLLPATVITFVSIVVGYIIFRPKKALGISKESFAKEYKKLGEVSFAEKKTAIILTLCFLFFLAGGLGIHQIPNQAIVLGGVFLLAISGVVEQSDISNGINWDFVIFVGSAMSLSGVFAEIGISGWIGSMLVPALGHLTGSPWLLVYSVVIILLIWRFFDIAFLTPTKAILVPVLPLVSQELGINPLLWVPIFVMVGNSFFLSYTNAFVLAGQSILGKDGWDSKQVNTYGLVYGLACLIALAISIPYWMHLGLF